MDPRVEKLKTASDCEVFERNALRLGEAALAIEARARKVEMKAEAYGPSTVVERECLEAIYAYEETLFVKNNKRTRATRTWQMLAKRGIIPAVEHTVTRPNETQGFKSLVDMGLSQFAFEAVILRYPEKFSSAAVAVSQRRMADWK